MAVPRDLSEERSTPEDSTRSGGRPAVFSARSGREVSEYFRMERWEDPTFAPSTAGAHRSAPSDGPGAGSAGEPPFGARIPIDAHERGPGGGIRAGALVSVLDSVGGMMSGLSVLPKWVVTTNLMVRFARLDHVGPLRLGGRVQRKGRSSVVSGMVVVDEGRDDAPVASVIATMAVLEPAEMNLVFERPVWVPVPDPPIEQVPIDEFFHLEPGSGATTRLDLVEHLRNPWGILHGGAVSILVDEAATRAAAALPLLPLLDRGVAAGDRYGADAGDASGGGLAPLCASDTVIHYVSPNRVGPIEARTTVLGDRGDAVVVRVAVHDLGASERLTALATVTVARLEQGR